MRNLIYSLLAMSQTARNIYLNDNPDLDFDAIITAVQAMSATASANGNMAMVGQLSALADHLNSFTTLNKNTPASF